MNKIGLHLFVRNWVFCIIFWCYEFDLTFGKFSYQLSYIRISLIVFHFYMFLSNKHPTEITDLLLSVQFVVRVFLKNIKYSYTCIIFEMLQKWIVNYLKANAVRAKWIEYIYNNCDYFAVALYFVVNMLLSILYLQKKNIIILNLYNYL